MLKANASLRTYVERMQEEADAYCHGDRRWTVINSFYPRLWPPARPQPDEIILMADDLGLIAMARARYEDLSEQEKMLDLSHLWASAGDLRPAGAALAAAGRGADDRLVHVATGEMVVPRELLANDPWLRSYIVRVFKAGGFDWRRYVVGGPNRINPATGLAEFDPFDTHDDFGDVGGVFDAREGYDNPNTDIDLGEGYDNPNTDIGGFDGPRLGSNENINRLTDEWFQRNDEVEILRRKAGIAPPESPSASPFVGPEKRPVTNEDVHARMLRATKPTGGRVHGGLDAGLADAMFSPHFSRLKELEEQCFLVEEQMRKALEEKHSNQGGQIRVGNKRKLR